MSPLIAVFRVFLYYGLPSRIARPSTIDVLENFSLESSARYIEEHGERAMIFRKRNDLWRFSINSAKKNGVYAEFCVSWGKSLNFISRHLPKGRIIYGFDSFQGLKEDFWGTPFTRGAFSTNRKIPSFPNNVKLVEGWFNETLPSFLQVHTNNFSFIHLDADTYNSTKEILDLLGGRIDSGTVIVFDEYLGIPNWKNNEAKAWKEFVELHKIDYTYIAFSNQSVAIKIE